MKLELLITELFKKLQLDPIKPKNGIYHLDMTDFSVSCYSRSGRVYLEALLADIPKESSIKDEWNQKLAEVSLSFIRSQRASLSINQELKQYSLHRRMKEADLQINYFEKALADFGSCFLYIKNVMKTLPTDN